MKKHIVILLLGMGVLTMSAEDYTHSVGGVVGSMYGVSYKGFVLSVEHLALETDLAVRLSSSIGGDGTFSETVDFFTFEFHPNVVYQRTIAEFDMGRIDWYAGGGLSLGMFRKLDPITAAGIDLAPTLGKLGINATAGAEIVFDAPIHLSLDFRPGYGLAFNDSYHASFFDWAIALSIRYRI